ncbi:MAG: hypothetical protein ACRCW9_03135 [Cetobacterium sp.]
MRSTERRVFHELSETGINFIIYEDIGNCECYTPDSEEIFDREPNPYHKACLGTGKKRRIHVTKKLRFLYTSVTKDSNLEKQSFEKLKSEYLTIYFPENYSNLKYTDIIAMIKLDEKNNIVKPFQPVSFYKIVAIDDFYDGDFKYFSVKLNKILYLPYEEVL